MGKRRSFVTVKRWRFGKDQTSKQEKAEIRNAQAGGLELDYMKGQDWARMIEHETERRRARKRAARYEM
jgi:hypothetical protein